MRNAHLRTSVQLPQLCAGFRITSRCGARRESLPNHYDMLRSTWVDVRRHGAYLEERCTVIVLALREGGKGSRHYHKRDATYVCLGKRFSVFQSLGRMFSKPGSHQARTTSYYQTREILRVLLHKRVEFQEDVMALLHVHESGGAWGGLVVELKRNGDIPWPSSCSKS